MTMSQAANKRETILAVDDAPDNLELISSLLKESYRVKIACSGEKALDIVRSSPPDLVLLDIMMPGMDGYEVCRRLKSSAATADIPIIFLTARTEVTDETHGFELGAVDYITKPLSPPILMARIRTHLRLKEVAEFLRNKNYFLETEVARRTCEVIEANQLNRHIVSCAQEGIVVHDRDLHYVIWNPFMEELTGIAAAEVIGRKPLELFPELHGKGVLDELERALSGETVPARELSFSIAATGRSGWIYNTTAPLRNAAGEIIGVIRTISDISGQKLAEEQYRHAQKLEVVGQLAGGVAHDFNNILSVIIGYCELLEMSGNLDAHQQEQVKQILNASERAAQLTGGLLSFCHKQVALPQLQNLNSIVQNIEKFLVRVMGEGIQIRLDLCTESLPVTADSGQIQQVVINLATNARDAMQSRGMLQIATGLQELAAPLANAHGHSEPGLYARIDVSDTGCGMDQATLGRVFEPFFTTKEVGKGTGLGMAIISGIVLQHNGAITVSSAPGEGTTFSIYLPLATSEPVMSGQTPRSQALPTGTETILLVEDDTSLRNLLATILVQYGYKVISAADGQDAVEKFAVQSNQIDLILTDVVMPRENGREVAAASQRIRPDVRILFMSGHTADVVRVCGIDELGMDLIAKPVQTRQLLRKIRELLDA